MKVKNLTSALKLISKISNPASLTSIFKAVELKENALRANSEFGNIHLLLPETTGLPDAVLLETEALLAISSSLSPDSEITFEEKPSHVAWSCVKDDAKGKLNFVVTDSKIADITHTEFPWAPPKDFGKALKLASAACQQAAVSFGLYGIEMFPIDNKIYMMSSNNVSLAATEVDRGDFPDLKVTLRPPVPDIIKAILETCPTSTMDITEKGIYIIGDFLLAQLHLGVPLDFNLKEISDKYRETKKTMSINTSSIKKFLQRARSLTEKQMSFTVTMKIEEGRLLLEHRGISSSSEQYFLAEGLDTSINYEGVSLPAELVMTALEDVDKVVCDYLSEKQLILRGSTPEFLYIVGGNEVHAHA